MIRRSTLAAVLCLLLASASVAAATRTVQMNNNFFDKATMTLPMADSVQWQNPAGGPNHTATANLFGYFNFFVADGSTSPTRLFNRAGAFAYRCTIHPTQMKGTIKVRMRATPSSGTDESTIFTIRVATGSAAAGFVQDVQMRKGSAPFAQFITLNNTTQTTTFNPSSPGRYQFRSRLRQLGGSATPYSPAVTINVT